MVDLWKRAVVLFSLELTGLGQASGPRAGVPQARNPRPAAKAVLCSVQAQAAFPPQLRSPCTSPPTQGATRLITLAGSQGWCQRVRCSARPAQETQGDRCCTWQLLPLILATQGRGEVTQTPARDWKA